MLLNYGVSVVWWVEVVRHVEAKRSSEDTLAILVSNTTKMGTSDTKYGIRYCIVVIMLHRKKKTFAGEYCTCHVLVGAADFTRRGGASPPARCQSDF